jgi:hypothetical protein
LLQEWQHARAEIGEMGQVPPLAPEKIAAKLGLEQFDGARQRR